MTDIQNWFLFIVFTSAIHKMFSMFNIWSMKLQHVLFNKLKCEDIYFVRVSIKEMNKHNSKYITGNTESISTGGFNGISSV